MRVRIAHLSDPHFGALDETVADAAPEAVRALHPDVVVLTGDLTMAGRRAEFRRAREFLDRLPQPLVVIPGNHDIPKFNQLYDRLFQPFRRYRRYVASELEPIREFNGVRIAGLNSSRAFGPYLDWSRGRLSDSQIEGIADRFADAEPHCRRVLGIHHPTIAPPRNRRDLVMPLDALKLALAHARIDIVLGGHFHQSYLLALPCGAPSGWSAVVSQVSTVTSTRLQGEPNGFHMLDLYPDRLDAERFEWNGTAFASRELLHFGRDEKTGWHLRENALPG